MRNMYSLKEDAIRKYIAGVNWKGDWSHAKIEEDMRRFLGERPTLDVKWEKDVMVNEMSGETSEIDKITKISIIFTDTDDRLKKLEILT
jgi:hypothetical protein